MDMLRYVMTREKYCMGNCLIKGSQTCSQTCSSLAPSEGECTLESAYVSIHLEIFNANIWKTGEDINTFLSSTGKKKIYSLIWDMKRHSSSCFSFLVIECSLPCRGLHILGFWCFYSSTPIGGNIIILTKVTVELCRVSQAEVAKVHTFFTQVDEQTL